MKVKQVFALAALALAAGTVLADESPHAPLTRAQVVQAAGQGELAPQVARAPRASSTVSRAQVKAGVLLARANHELVHGGATYQPTITNVPRSNLSRAQVEADVLAARADHELRHGQIEQPEGAMAFGSSGA
ncbi:MAG TPA: hypothetical protein VII31_05490 [Caldimonas sp.]|jgi:hypothetical protein